MQFFIIIILLVHMPSILNTLFRTSLVVQWLVLHFLCSGCRFDPWLGKFHMLLRVAKKKNPKNIFHLILKIILWSEVKSLSCVQLFATPWTVACQAPLSMGFSRQDYWSGLPFPSSGDLPNPGIEPRSPAL